MDIYTLHDTYHNRKKRIQLLEELRWADGTGCPRCGHPGIRRCGWRPGYWACTPCRREFTVLVGTIFERTHIDLQKWFDAIAMVSNSKLQISAKNLASHLAITHANAWSMAMRIRCACTEWPFSLSGQIEADEMYYGPKKHKKRNKNILPQPPGTDLSTLTSEQKWGKFPKGKGTIKPQVVGFIERGGRIAARTFLWGKKAKSQDMLALMLENVVVEDSTLMTDGAKEYRILDDYIHREVVDHSAKEYARGDVHTNTIESLWSRYKKGLTGVHIRIDEQYLPLYLAEFTFKYNRRHLSDRERFWELMERAVNRRKRFTGFRPERDTQEMAYDQGSDTNRIEYHPKG